MRAKRKAVQQRIEQPGVPEEILMINPEFAALNAQKEALQQKREQLKATFSKPDDPRIQVVDREIALLNGKIKKLSGDHGELTQTIQIQDKAALSTLDQEIQAQEILVTELTNKYQEQRIKSAQRVENEVEIAFDQEELRRVNKIIETIDARIFALQVPQKGNVNSVENEREDSNPQALLLRILKTLERIESRLDATQDKK
jgi:hypothetical protein